MSVIKLANSPSCRTEVMLLATELNPSARTWDEGRQTLSRAVVVPYPKTLAELFRVAMFTEIVPSEL